MTGIHRIPVRTLLLVLLSSLVMSLAACGAAGQTSPESVRDVDRIVEDLNEMRASVESATQENYPEMAAEVERLRQELQQIYEGTPAASGEGWEAVESELQTLEEQLRAGSDDTLTTFDTVIDQLRSDLQPDGN